MPGYKYGAPRPPRARIHITPEEESAIETELWKVRGPNITDEMAGVTQAPIENIPGLAQCGTVGGYSAHRRRGEVPCASCKAANAAYSAAKRQSTLAPQMIDHDQAA